MDSSNNLPKPGNDQNPTRPNRLETENKNQRTLRNRTVAKTVEELEVAMHSYASVVAQNPAKVGSTPAVTVTDVPANDAPGPQRGKNGAAATKHVCFSCKGHKWTIDYTEGKKADLHSRSVCLFCKLADRADKAQAQIKAQEVAIKQHFDALNAQADGLRREFKSRLDGLSLSPADPSSSVNPALRPMDREVSRVNILEERLVQLEKRLEEFPPPSVVAGAPKTVAVGGDDISFITDRIRALEISMGTVSQTLRDRLGPPSPSVPTQQAKDGGKSGGRKQGAGKGVSREQSWRLSSSHGSGTSARPAPPPPPPPEKFKPFTTKRQKKNIKKKARNQDGAPGSVAVPAQPDTILIGDSLVARETSRHFLGLRKENKALAFPGARISHVTREITQLKNMTRETTLMVSVGGNDLFLRNGKCGSAPKILADFEKLMKETKRHTSRAVIVGLLPRTNTWWENDSNSWKQYHTALEINVKLASMCKQHSLRFLNLWDKFYGQNALYFRDGIHFSRSGAKAFANYIDARRFGPVGMLNGSNKGRQPGTQKKGSGVGGGLNPSPRSNLDAVVVNKLADLEVSRGVGAGVAAGPMLSPSSKSSAPNETAALRSPDDGLMVVSTVADVHSAPNNTPNPRPKRKRKRRNRESLEPSPTSPARRKRQRSKEPVWYDCTLGPEKPVENPPEPSAEIQAAPAPPTPFEIDLDEITVISQGDPPVISISDPAGVSEEPEPVEPPRPSGN